MPIGYNLFVGPGPRYGILLEPYSSSVVPGDDVYSPGLFVRNYGDPDAGNLPVARFGRVSRMPSIIHTPRYRDDEFESPAYLVEFQSWGGVSGSPVFRIDEYRTLHHDPRDPLNNQKCVAQAHSHVSLLGIVNGHQTVRQKPRTADGVPVDMWMDLNAGLTVVTPISAVVDSLNRDDVAADRARIEVEKKGHGELSTEMDVFPGGESMNMRDNP